MTTRNSLLQKLPLLFEDWNKAKKKLETLNQKQIDTEVRGIFEINYQEDIRTCWNRLNQALEEYDYFPDRFHDQLKDADTFWKDGDLHTSVFIMTKFPEKADIEAGKPEAV